MNKSIVQLALEALNTGDVPKRYFDPSKQRLASAPHEIEDILPTAEGQDRFIEIITSKGYEMCVKKLASYLEMPLEQVLRQYPNVNAFGAVVMQTLQEVMQLERNNKQTLEQLALQVVLDLPEFSVFKKAIENGQLNIDVKLGPAELQNALTMDDEIEGAPPADADDLGEYVDGLGEQVEDNQEELVEYVEQEIEYDPERKLKRAFHNFITQGNAVHKSFLFNMVNEELSQIDEKLPVKYGLLMSIVHVLYYGTPYVEGNILKQVTGLGSAEIGGGDGAGGGGPRGLIVRGMVFPVLVHEIVKGLFDFLGQDVSPATHGSERLEDEYMQLMAGPELFNKLNAMIPRNKSELLPLIYRLLLAQDANDIKTVVAGGDAGKAIITRLASEAERRSMEQDQEPDEDLDFGGDGFDADQGGDEDEGDDPYNLYGGY